MLRKAFFICSLLLLTYTYCQGVDEDDATERVDRSYNLCGKNLRLGRNVPNSTVVFTTNVLIPAKPGDYVTSTKNYTGNPIITKIIANTANSHGRACVQQGGVGFNHVTLGFRSGKGRLLDYDVMVSGRAA